jgi:ribosomal protein S18 acetylase RimI-like enzyme
MLTRLRNDLRCGDPALIQAMIQDTGFFTPAEEDIARDLALETLAKPGEYLFIFAEARTPDESWETAGYICYGEIPGSIGSYDLYWLAVPRRLQRFGLGRLLVLAAEKDILSRGGRQAFLSTSGSGKYQSTRAFYDKIGYTQAAFLPDFYNIGDPQVIYRKVL